jgi:hypothetical protein
MKASGRWCIELIDVGWLQFEISAGLATSGLPFIDVLLKIRARSRYPSVLFIDFINSHTPMAFVITVGAPLTLPNLVSALSYASLAVIARCKGVGYIPFVGIGQVFPGRVTVNIRLI